MEAAAATKRYHMLVELALKQLSTLYLRKQAGAHMYVWARVYVCVSLFGCVIVCAVVRVRLLLYYINK